MNEFVQEVKADWESMSYSEQQQMLRDYPELKQAGLTMTAFNPSEVRIGDLVNFGNYGTYYVCGYGESSEDTVRVTDSEEDRANYSARGKYLSLSQAKRIVERL